MQRLTLIPAYDRQEELVPLFTEYTKMLVETDQCLAPYLVMQNYEQELADLKSKYAPPEGRLYLALWDGASAGCIALRRMDAQCGELKRLYVRPEFRGHGIGTAMIRQILSDARAIGYRHVLLDTLPVMHSAVRLYREAGFYDIPCYNDNPIDYALFMQRDL